MDTMDEQIDKSWKKILQDEFDKAYFSELTNFVQSENKDYEIYPEFHHIFKAFECTPFDAVRVVIIGQDPYHGPGQAHGLCFSVQDGMKIPPSLVNIFKELQRDLAFQIPNHGNLTHWAQQGVLLLNATLTVRAKEAGSHQNKGWEKFTDNVISKISSLKENVVFMLWGNDAKSKKKLINNEKHLILESVHPSPLSAYRGFLGCGHFSSANKYLISKGYQPIDWQLI